MTELRTTLNYLADTIDLDAQGAANAWAFTEQVDLVGALNIKAGTTGLGLNKVLQVLALMWGGDPTLDSGDALDTAIRFTIFPDNVLFPELDIHPGVA